MAADLMRLDGFVEGLGKAAIQEFVLTAAYPCMWLCNILTHSRCSVLK